MGQGKDSQDAANTCRIGAGTHGEHGAGLTSGVGVQGSV